MLPVRAGCGDAPAGVSIPVAVLSIFFRQLVVGERTITAVINFVVLGGSSTFVACLYFEMKSEVADDQAVKERAEIAKRVNG